MQLSMVQFVCDFSIHEAEAEGLPQIQGQPELPSETLSQNTKTEIQINTANKNFWIYIIYCFNFFKEHTSLKKINAKFAHFVIHIFTSLFHLYMW